ncbi:MAG TPA: hypothetical protein VNP72_10260, partial [Longimicrobium sp.]|nr:hypothetical protein [Longimicrobium sp.]
LPLVVLAILSTVGGFLNVENVPIVSLFDFGQGTALHAWLHPVISGSEEVIRARFGEPEAAAHRAWPIVLAVVIGVGGLALAFGLLGRRALGTAEEQPAYRGGVQRWLYNKYYVDELYDRIVVRPVNWLSQREWGFDRGLDATVDFFGRTAQALGMLVGRMQTGLVNTYALAFIVGALVLLGSFVAF